MKISKGFTELKPSAYTATIQEPLLDFRQSPAERCDCREHDDLGAGESVSAELTCTRMGYAVRIKQCLRLLFGAGAAVGILLAAVGAFVPTGSGF